MKSLWYFFSNFDNTIWFQIKHLFWTAACHKKIYLLVQDRILFYNFQNPCLPTTNNFYIFVNVISCWLLQHSYLIYRRWNLDMTVKVFAINFAIFLPKHEDWSDLWKRYKGNFSKKIFDWLVWISSTVHLIQLDIRRHNYFILESYVSIFGLMLRQNHYYLGHKSISRW